MGIRIRNWEKFQHFRDRHSPWIKLYRELLDDPAWHRLDPRASKTLIMLWLSAFEHLGELPPLEKLAFKLRMKESELQQELTKLSEWLVRDDDSLISNGDQADDSTSQERERRERGERDTVPALISKGRKIKAAGMIPPGWLPSESTMTSLSAEFRFTNGDGERYVAAFIDACQAKGYEYRDFDAAFRNCVRQDWPRFRNGGKTMPKHVDPNKPRLT